MMGVATLPCCCLSTRRSSVSLRPRSACETLCCGSPPASAMCFLEPVLPPTARAAARPAGSESAPQPTHLHRIPSTGSFAAYHGRQPDHRAAPSHGASDPTLRLAESGPSLGDVGIGLHDLSVMSSRVPGCAMGATLAVATFTAAARLTACRYPQCEGTAMRWSRRVGQPGEVSMEPPIATPQRPPVD